MKHKNKGVIYLSYLSYYLKHQSRTLIRKINNYYTFH